MCMKDRASETALRASRVSFQATITRRGSSRPPWGGTTSMGRPELRSSSDVLTVL